MDKQKTRNFDTLCTLRICDKLLLFNSSIQTPFSPTNYTFQASFYTLHIVKNHIWAKDGQNSKISGLYYFKK